LFEEMTALSDFHPRVPPYNTMIQFFVSTQPDREQALYYFKKMLGAGVNPSEHTYKLLLDCYGMIQPVDVASLRDVFSRLEGDKYVKVESVHWAALINSYGLAQSNLPEAIEIFNRIPNHRDSTGLQDAICYEALIYACFANGEYAKVEEYAELMQDRRVHSTAYIENTRIKVSYSRRCSSLIQLMCAQTVLCCRQPHRTSSPGFQFASGSARWRRSSRQSSKRTKAPQNAQGAIGKRARWPYLSRAVNIRSHDSC
jgi:pentatricopeptide repeat protein